MTRSEFSKLIDGLKTVYPKEGLFPTEESKDIWFRYLQDLDYKNVAAFLNKWIMTEQWSPTIADIRAGVAEISFGVLPSWGEAWEKVLRAVRKYGYMGRERALSSLDPVTQKAVKSIGWQAICESENPDVIRGQFRKEYETHQQRISIDNQLPEKFKTDLERLTEMGVIAKISDKMKELNDGS